MVNELRIKLYLSAGAQTDLERLRQRAQEQPHSRNERLYEATFVMLNRLNGRRHPTKPLDFKPHMADLSDCDTTYVGDDPYEKPPLRIVSRDIPPDRAGGITRREVIAIGPRQDERAYRMSSQRLGRRIGVPLTELEAQVPRIEPTKPTTQQPPRRPEYRPSIDIDEPTGEDEQQYG